MSKEKNKLEELEKQLGLNRTPNEKKEVISSGSIGLDLALGNGGFMVGKIVEAFGDFSSGKSTSTLHLIKEAQIRFPDKKVALLDYENSFDAAYAQSVGVDIDSLIIYQPTTMEQGYNMAIKLVENEIVSVIVIDSHTAATPQKVLDGEIGDATIGLAARLNSTFLSKIKGELNKHNVLLFAISQLRSNIGGYGAAETTTGGNAWKFYSDVRLRFQKSVDKDKELSETTITVVKNKCAVPFRQAKINILWGKGYDTLGELIDIGIQAGFIIKGGAWLTYGENKIQGKEKFKELLQDNPEFLNEIKEKVNNYLYA